MAVIWEQHFLTLKTLLRIESWKILSLELETFLKQSG